MKSRYASNRLLTISHVTREILKFNRVKTLVVRAAGYFKISEAKLGRLVSVYDTGKHFVITMTRTVSLS